MMAQRTRKPYPTDLSDAEWRIIEPLLPRPSTRRGRPRVHSYREILNAIFYVLRTGGAWRMLPHDFPPWQTVYHDGSSLPMIGDLGYNAGRGNPRGRESHGS